MYEDKKLQESVAAPTAAHFDEELLDSIKKLGVKFATINSSVGLVFNL